MRYCLDTLRIIHDQNKPIVLTKNNELQNQLVTEYLVKNDGSQLQKTVRRFKRIPDLDILLWSDPFVYTSCQKLTIDVQVEGTNFFSRLSILPESIPQEIEDVDNFLISHAALSLLHNISPREAKPEIFYKYLLT